MLLQPKEAEKANKTAAAAASLPLPPDSDEDEPPPASAPANGFAPALLSFAPLTSAPKEPPADLSFLAKPVATGAPLSFNFGGSTAAAAAPEPGAQAG